MRKFTSCETVEVVIDNASKTKFYFPELPNLRNKVIERIDTYDSSMVSKTPSNRDVVNGGVIGNSFLVIVNNGNEVINRIPMRLLTPDKTFINLFPFNYIIDYPKSYIEVGNVSSLTAGNAFVFTFYFKEKEFSHIIKSGSNLKIENVEVQINSSGTKYYFPDNENLRDKIIRKIETAYPIATNYSPSGDALIDSPTLIKSFLVLNSRNKEIINRLPLYSLQENREIESMIVLDDICVDFTKSYVEVPAVLSSTDKYFFSIFYFDKSSGDEHAHQVMRHKNPRSNHHWPFHHHR